MHRRVFSASVALLGVIILSPNVFAASGALVMPWNQTGAMVETNALRLERSKRISWIQLTTEMDAWEKETAAAKQQSLTNRSTTRAACRKQLLTANKDQALSIVLKCLRADMQLEQTWLLSYGESVQKLTGVQSRTRDILLDRVKKMQTALSTMVTGVDTGVFRTDKSLRDALMNLRTKYRAPLWDAQDAVRAERRLAALSVLVSDMRSASGSVIEPKSWKQAQGCVWMHEQVLLGRLVQPTEGTGATMESCFMIVNDALIKQMPVTKTGAVIPAKP